MLTSREEDIQMMLAAQCHIGTRNADSQMAKYIYKRRNDGIHIINLGETYDKLMLAARVIVAIENPADVCAISARPYGQRATLKFAQYTGAQAIAGRFTPGTFTNQITKQFKEPRLLIITDPRTDSQPVRESSYVNVPVIAFCDSDSPLQHVDVAIPANNKGKLSIGLLYWLLSREVLRLRSTISRTMPWEIVVDLFLYRDPEELEKADEAEPFADDSLVRAGWQDPGQIQSEVAPAAFQAEETSGDWGAAAPAPASADDWNAAPPAAPMSVMPPSGQQAPSSDWNQPAPTATGGSGWD